MPVLLALTSLFSQPWFRPYIEDRERYERHINPTFNGPKDANRSDLYNRVRLGANFDFSHGLKATLEYQNATDLYWTKAANSMTHNSDASLAFADYAAMKYDFSLGREKIALGEMRLIGPTEWTNLSRSFDVARAKSGPWDLWGGTLGMANKDTKTVRLADLTHLDKTWGTTSLILKHDLGSMASIDEQTLDHFVKRKFGNTTADAEAAVQIGANNLKDQSAWAYHARLTQDLFKKTTFSIEADAASGGSTSTISRTFDNLYPSNHDLYGLADTTGWKNMTYFAARLENRPSDRLWLRVSEQTFSLRDASDAWYSFSGAANAKSGGGVFQDPSGKSGTQLGSELDAEASWDLKKAGSFSAGLALFSPGDFVKNITQRDDNETFCYLQYQVRF
jgi:hypothetical protein